MASIGLFLFSLFFLLHSFHRCDGTVTPSHYAAPINRSSFPASFVFGAATAAYQIEGAANQGGKGPSIWDTFAKQHPEKIWDKSTGDVALDFYHRYKEDIHFLKDLGMDALRLSISWSRILPHGKVSGGINQEGIKFYNNVINELISKGLKPFVTLLHWDIPQALEDEYGGMLHTNIVNDFQDYVDICFKEFGDRVKHWITMNEPISFSTNGYTIGTQAPGRCSKYAGNCTAGNSATEPYIVAHNQLLAHAAAAKLYKQKYQKYQKGEIGITLASHWLVPKLRTVAGVKAAYRALDFMLGWFLHPLTYGDYPPSMRAIVGHRLPKFSEAQSKMLKGSMDFLGMNYYTSQYASLSLSVNRVNLSYSTDSHVELSTEKDGIPIGQTTALDWLCICPKGIRSLMLYIMKKYKNPPIYITENGMADQNNSTLPIQEALKDNLRIIYMHGHLWNLQKAIEQGANVKGHFVWSFMDDFEWDAGFTVRFGLAYIDYKDGLKRYPKHSAFWYKKFLQKAKVNLSYSTDSHVELSTEKDGIPIGQTTALDWLCICPKGIRSLMLYIMKKYNNPPIYITENGMADQNNSTLPIQEALKDNLRIIYMHGHLWNLQKAIEQGANVKGHFVWSFMDDFEWDAGFTVRFGLAYIDYKDGLKRYPKHSAFWYKKFLQKAK